MTTTIDTDLAAQLSALAPVQYNEVKDKLQVACGCQGLCDERGGCPLKLAAKARHEQTLISMALEQGHDARGVRDECMKQARELVAAGRRDLACGWLRMAMSKNREAVRCRRTAVQASRLIGNDYKPGDALKLRVMAAAERELSPLPDYNRPPRAMLPWRAILLSLAVWAVMALAVFGAGVVIGIFNKAEASTLDLEVSVGANVSQYLSGNKAFTGDPKSFDGGFAGPRDTIEFALVWRSDSQRWFCKLSHISHLSAGPPFNSRPEDFLERLEFGYRWRIGGVL